MNDIIKIVQALEDSNVLLKGVTKTTENETKEQNGGFLSMLLGTLGTILLGNLLTGKGIERAGSGNNKGKRIVRAGSGRTWSPALQNNKGKGNCKSCFCLSFVLCFAKTAGFLIPPYPLTNFEIQKYYENKSRFNGVYSRNNLPKKLKDGAYVINLDEHADTGTHWIALFCSRN